MTRKITPAQLDEIEKSARAEITARVAPGSPDQLGRVRREFDAFLKAAAPINVLAPIYDLREADVRVALLAEAWQEGWDAAHETPWTDGPTNPYLVN